MEEIKPFKKLPLNKFFQYDLEKIMMSFRLSDTIRKDVTNVRAAGDQVEFAVRDFFRSKLSPEYHVNDGHIVDENLKVSPQYDLIISENSKNSSLFSLADKSELFYYEPVYAFAEVKRSFYDKKIIENFSSSLKRFKNELSRKEIPANYLDVGSTGILVEKPLTNLAVRNPMLSFLFIVDASNLNTTAVRKTIEKTENKYLPNFIVLLDIGVILNINKNDYKNNKITVNLYPEYETEENIWVLLSLHDRNSVLIYQYMLLLEHLNSTTVDRPDVRKYTQKLFNISMSDIHKI